MNGEYVVEKIKYLCDSQGFSMCNMFKKCGIGTQILIEIKRGIPPTVDKLEAIACFLGTTVSDLLGETSPYFVSISNPYLLMRYDRMSPQNQERVMTFVEQIATEETISSSGKEEI